MKTTDSRDPTLHWELFIRQRGSATQGVPPGKEALTWVANTVTLIWGERDALLVDTFLSDAQTMDNTFRSGHHYAATPENLPRGSLSPPLCPPPSDRQP